MKNIVATEVARHSLRQIGRASREMFGVEQADLYRQQLRTSVARLANGTLPSRSCRAVIAADLREDIRFVRSGQHMIIFLESPTEIVVLDFLHQNMDLAGRIAKLG